MKNKSICFVGLDNYPIMNPEKGNEYFGGESVQQTLLAKAFRDIGYDVSMVVKDYGQQQAECINNIKIWKTFSDNEGIPIFRFFYPRLSSIIYALKKADADIYYQSCAGMLTGIVRWFCKKYNRKFIFRLASDSDCIPGEQIISLWRDRKIYEYGIKHADIIAAQSNKQICLLQENYGLKSTVVNMVVELPKSKNCDNRSIDILWVNNIRDCKQPHLVLKLATMLPKYRIVVIGGAVPGYEKLYEKIKQGSMLLRNIEFLGAVPYKEVNNYFSQTKLFINTSVIEGFPNSFLQAWIRKVPVISFFDPDGLISNKNVGLVPNNINEMVSNIEELLVNSNSREFKGKTAYNFITENYSPEVIAKEYITLINKC